MLAERQPVYTFLLVAVVCIAVIIGAQALAQASAPPVQQMSQSRIIGQAGFAYLGGLRMMGAGLLWGRLDAQYHQYGSLSQIQDRLDLLPSIRLVQMLNPQLEQPYYFTSYVLYLRHRMPDALALAREGIANNPQSGLLRANLIQLLFIENRHANTDEMIRQAEAGMRPNATYSSIDDQYESFGIFRTAYLLTGNKEKVAEINQVLRQLETLKPGVQQSKSGFFGLIDAWANSATTPETEQSTPATSTPK